MKITGQESKLLDCLATKKLGSTCWRLMLKVLEAGGSLKFRPTDLANEIGLSPQAWSAAATTLIDAKVLERDGSGYHAALDGRRIADPEMKDGATSAMTQDGATSAMTQEDLSQDGASFLQDSATSAKTKRYLTQNGASKMKDGATSRVPASREDCISFSSSSEIEEKKKEKQFAHARGEGSIDWDAIPPGHTAVINPVSAKTERTQGPNHLQDTIALKAEIRRRVLAARPATFDLAKADLLAAEMPNMLYGTDNLSPDTLCFGAWKAMTDDRGKSQSLAGLARSIAREANKPDFQWPRSAPLAALPEALHDEARAFQDQAKAENTGSCTLPERATPLVFNKTTETDKKHLNEIYAKNKARVAEERRKRGILS